MLNRRKFLVAGVAGLAGATVLVPKFLRASEIQRMKTIGLQSWVIKDDLVKDFSGTLKKINALGYNSIEMCSPAGYADYGFGPLQHMAASEMKGILRDAGFSCESCHYTFSELKDHLQDRIKFAKELGLKQMVVSSFGLPKTAKLDDWKKAADETNEIGEITAKAGLPLAFHNHNVEFEKLDGQMIYDVLLSELDPSLVKMQFQVWVVSIGHKAADYFKKYPGRFISAHLYDWSGSGEEMVALGKGVVDWKEFFAAAKTSGVKNFYVEMGMPYLKESAEFLKNWKA